MQFCFLNQNKIKRFTIPLNIQNNTRRDIDFSNTYISKKIVLGFNDPLRIII